MTSDLAIMQGTDTSLDGRAAVRVNSLDEFWEDSLVYGFDIREHMICLRNLARGCSNVVEFGVHNGGSTAAFLHGCPGTVDSWDIERTHQVQRIESVAGGRWTFHHESSLVAKPPDCDLAFIDSWHSAAQVAAELAIVAPITRKWIGLHDTVTFGSLGEDKGPGIRTAITAFLAKNPLWAVERDLTYCNGLMMLQRTR